MCSGKKCRWYKTVKLQIPDKLQYEHELMCYPKINLRKLEEPHIYMKKLQLFDKDLGFRSLRRSLWLYSKHYCWNTLL
jgi:predicted rRNA methylase YqxC with S4 and FtsJ domains